MSIQDLCPFLLFLLTCSSLFFLDINLLSDIWAVNIFSFSIGFFFTLLIGSFDAQKFLGVATYLSKATGMTIMTMCILGVFLTCMQELFPSGHEHNYCRRNLSISVLSSKSAPANNALCED